MEAMLAGPAQPDQVLFLVVTVPVVLLPGPMTVPPVLPMMADRAPNGYGAGSQPHWSRRNQANVSGH
jgi:hypothetical protein